MDTLVLSEGWMNVIIRPVFLALIEIEALGKLIFSSASPSSEFPDKHQSYLGMFKLSN